MRKKARALLGGILLTAPLWIGPLISAKSPSDTVAYNDTNGQRFLALAGLTEAQHDRIFEQLGLDPGTTPRGAHLVRESPGSEGKALHSWRSEFFRIDQQEKPSKQPVSSVPGANDRLAHEVLDAGRAELMLSDQAISATWTRLDGPEFEVRDSLGGVVEFRNTGYGVKWAKDPSGFLVGVTYDSQHRATLVHIGLDYYLETVYADTEDVNQRWEWSERRLWKRTGELLGRWEWNDQIPPPRASARAWATTGLETSVVAEWDSEHYPHGVAVLTTQDVVSLLAPLEEGAQIWRSISLPSQDSVGKRPSSIGRLDFNDNGFRIWIDLGRPLGFQDQPTLNSYAVISLPRERETPERLERFRKAGPF